FRAEEAGYSEDGSRASFPAFSLDASQARRSADACRGRDRALPCRVAQLTRDGWSLAVDGLIERPRVLSFDDLVRYPKVELASVHQCCGVDVRASHRLGGSHVTR